MKELPSNSNQYSIEIFSLSLTTLLTHHLPSPGQCDPGLNISLSKHHISIIPANYHNSQASQATSPCIHIWSNFTILLNLIKYVLPPPRSPWSLCPAICNISNNMNDKGSWKSFYSTATQWSDWRGKSWIEVRLNQSKILLGSVCLSQTLKKWMKIYFRNLLQLFSIKAKCTFQHVKSIHENNDYRYSDNMGTLRNHTGCLSRHCMFQRLFWRFSMISLHCIFLL